MSASPVSGTVPTQAVVLCAGEGRRLRPFTERRPKPLLPLLNVPLLRHTLRLLARSGVQRVALNAWCLSEQILAFAESRPEPGLDLHVEVEPTLLGTGGGLANLSGWRGDGPLLVLTSDVLADFDLAGLASRHAARGAEASMTLVTDADIERYGAVEMDDAGDLTDIVGLVGRPGTAAAVNGSVHLLSAAFLERLPAAAGPSCLVRDGYVPALREGAAIAGFVHQGPWAEIGTPELLLAAQRAALAGDLPLDPALMAECGPSVPTRSRVHRSASVSAAAVLEDTVVGPRAHVGAGARLRGCVVLPGAEIAPNAVHTDAVLDAAARTAPAQPQSTA